MPKLTNPVGDENYVIGSGLPRFIPNYNSPRLTNFMGSQSQTYSIGSSLPVHVPTDFAQIVIKNSAEREQAIKVLAFNLKTKIKDQDLTRDNFTLYGQDQVFLIHGNEAVNNLGKYFLNASSIGFNKGVGKIICDQWLELGNKYLKYTIYDYMREIGMLPLQEDPEMIRQLQAQLAEMQEAFNQRNNIIVERDNSILQLQGEKNVLTDRLATSEEEKVIIQEKLVLSEQKHVVLQNENNDLTDKLTVSEAKLVPLQEKVAELKHDKEILESDKKALQEDKIELREFNKMLIDDKKMLQEEKKLLLVDKKLFQDLSVTKDNELLELKHLHFDIEHCTFIGHCNNPDHE